VARTLLIFPPTASPTYVPLGIALLCAHVERQLGPGLVPLLDLIIWLWERLAAETAEGRAYLRYLRGQEGDFFDAAEHLRRQEAGRGPARGMAELTAQAQRFLAGAAAGPGLAAFLEEATRQILATRPDRIGFSLLFHTQLPLALALAYHLAGQREILWPASGAARGESTTLRLLLGGASLSNLEADELLLACPFIDGLVLGEGEEALTALCREASPAVVPGLWQRLPGGDGVVRQRPARPVDLDELPPPDFRQLPLDRYFSPEPVLPAVSSRGCRWRRCRFCAHNYSFGTYRQKCPERFAAELLEQQRRHGARHFYLGDQYIDAADLRRIAEELLRQGADLRWHVMGRPTADFDQPLLDLLAAAGCRWISWGVETGSQRLLDVARKGTAVAETREVLRRTARAGIASLPMMLFGLPGSTDEDLAQTFELLEDVYDGITAMTASAFVLYRATPFGRRPEKYGLQATEQEVLLHVGERPVHSRRLHHLELAADGSPRPPRGAVEVSLWKQRRRWLGEPGLLDKVCAEHFLLLAGRCPRVAPAGGPELPHPDLPSLPLAS